MASVLYQVGDKVKDLLTAGQAAAAFTTSIRPVLGFEVRLKLEDSGLLHVDVVPVKAVLRVARGNIATWETEVDIGVRYGYTASDLDSVSGLIKAASISPYLLLVEEITEYLARRANRTLATVNAGWRGGEVLLNYAPEHLSKHQFTGVSRHRYDVEVSIAS